jgi:hypothetical protein
MVMYRRHHIQIKGILKLMNAGKTTFPAKYFALYSNNLIIFPYSPKRQAGVPDIITKPQTE